MDKSNPNWRLVQRLNISVPDKDPVFEKAHKVPIKTQTAVTSLGWSRLAIKAVLTKDYKLLKQLKTSKEVWSMHLKRSVDNEMTALHYALQMEDLAAVRILLEPEKKSQVRADPPSCLLPVQDTGA